MFVLTISVIHSLLTQCFYTAYHAWRGLRRSFYRFWFTSVMKQWLMEYMICLQAVCHGINPTGNTPWSRHRYHLHIQNSIGIQIDIFALASFRSLYIACCLYVFSFRLKKTFSVEKAHNATIFFLHSSVAHSLLTWAIHLCAQRDVYWICRFSCHKAERNLREDCIAYTCSCFLFRPVVMVMSTRSDLKYNVGEILSMKRMTSTKSIYN